MKKEKVLALDVIVKKEHVSALYKAVKDCHQEFNFVSAFDDGTCLLYNVCVSGNAQDVFWFGMVFESYLERKIRKETYRHD